MKKRIYQYRLVYQENFVQTIFFISNIEEAVAWGKSQNLDYLITESAGLCNRCSPYIQDVLAIGVIDCLSGLIHREKLGQW